MSAAASLAGLLDARTLLRLALVPAAVWVASLAARRWGHAASGYLGGLPMIGGPITLYLALDYGPAFAARSATFTLAVILAQAAHLLAFAHAARFGRWPLALLAGWSSFAAVAVALAFASPGPFGALALAACGLAAAWLWLPRAKSVTPPPAIPRAELRLRLVAAAVLAAVILWSARAFGPVVSGVLLSVPVTGSIMPPFTLALYGADALARLARGFVVGLSGFAAFFFVLATSLPSLGTAPGFAAAVAAALGAAFTVDRLARGGARP
ncbi:MAG TPA: hypothetical protein VLS49_16870 [Usitatibacter sp.]|nr:hypothetical protein [Usitatibacter sp.]